MNKDYAQFIHANRCENNQQIPGEILKWHEASTKSSYSISQPKSEHNLHESSCDYNNHTTKQSTICIVLYT